MEHEDPQEVTRQLFAQLIYPHDPKTFFKKFWLKKPLHIKRKDPEYYTDDAWFSTDELDRILTEVGSLHWLTRLRNATERL